jgi:hypothetical protein
MIDFATEATREAFMASAPWIEAAGVLLLALAAYVAGRRVSRLRQPWWMLGYVLPLAAGVVVVAARQQPALMFSAPFRWILFGRLKFAVVAAAAGMLDGVIAARLPRRTTRVLLGVLTGSVVLVFAVFPFLVPGLIRDDLAALETQIDANGVCRQSTDYNCGPAAAVTALRSLGFPAEEGELAILCGTNPVTGTDPDSLCLSLSERYSRDGLRCEFRRFDAIHELYGREPVIAVLGPSPFTDHYATVLEVGTDHVTVADPRAGHRRMTFGEFHRLWRYCGLVLRRDRPVQRGG